MDNRKKFLKYMTSLLLFGTNGIVASGIALSSYEIVLVRTLIGSLLLIAVFLFTRQGLQLFKNRQQACYLIISGVAMGASWMFLYEAYKRMGVGLASLAYYCGPVIVMAFAPVVFGERMTRSKAAGFIVVIAGMLLVNAQALSEIKSAWGLLCGLMSALLYAVMIIFNKKASRINGLENPMWQLLTAFVTVALFVGAKQGLIIHVLPQSWPPIMILGLINTGIGCYFYFSSIGKLPVQTVAICGYLEPLAAVCFSMLFLHESMSAVQALGAMMILGGAAFGELYPYFAHEKISHAQV